MANESFSRRRIVAQLLLRLAAFLVGMAVLVFLPAGSLAFWGAWYFIGLLLVLVSVTFIYLLIHDPGLLAKRMNYHERRPEQRFFVKLGSLFIMIAFTIPGFDYRFGWSPLPDWTIWLGAFFLLAGYALFILVLRYNSFASRVIEIQAGQTLVDKGPYAIIRHPMYLGALLIYLAYPLMLGSLVGVLVMVGFPLLLPIRILNEEKMLSEELPGYTDYMHRVRYRLIPFIW